MLYVSLIYLIPIFLLKRKRIMQSLDSILRYSNKSGDMNYMTDVIGEKKF